MRLLRGRFGIGQAAVDLNGADHRDLPRSTPDFSAKKMEKGGGSSPAASSRYFCETTATLCEPNCAVNEVFATFAPVA